MASASSRRLALIFLWLSLIYVRNATALFPPHPRSVRLDTSFQWSSITPSEDLVYQDCYRYTLHAESTETLPYHPHSQSYGSQKGDEHYRCARLLVPLDWQNASNPNKVAIAIIKLPAKLSVKGHNRTPSKKGSPRIGASYGGAVVVNPGGPGGSGVQSVLSAGQMIQGLIDGEKSFDVLSFDPRGVAFSTPSAHCFDDYLADEIWDFKMRVVGHLDTGPEAIKMQFANEKGRAALCAEAASYDGSDDNIRAYMTTAYVARDMLEIVTKNHVVEGGESSGRHGTAAAHTDQRQQPLQRNSKAQLQYIGVSYGTFLGNTFASMYPEHVGKMLLDGNVDADDWVRRWPKTFLPDFEEGWSTFFERCYAVGSTCALWRSSDKVAADIRTRVDSTLEQVKNSPIPILSHGSTELITYSDIKNAIFASNYDAAGSFPRLASFLNAIHTGNTTQSLPGWIGTLSPPISCPAPNTSAWPNEAAFFSRDASFATLCSDGPSLSSTPPSSFQSYLTLLSSQSPTAAPILASWILACMAWPSSSTPLKPKWRFTGPFGTTATSTNSTATPILFLNNRLDPVCPIRNARKMAERYEGSVVLEQDAVGHCALTASLGACVRGWVRRYFNEGVLPEVGTVCEGGCRAFDEGCAVGEEAIKLW